MFRVGPLLGGEFCERHALAAPRARRQQKNPFDTVGVVQRQLLCDHAAERKPDDIELVQSEGIVERQGMPRHRQDGFGRFAPGTSDPGIVKEDDVVIGGEAVGDQGIPVVQVSAKVVHEDEREPTRLSPTPVGEASIVHVNKPRRYSQCQMCSSYHLPLLGFFTGP